MIDKPFGLSWAVFIPVAVAVFFALSRGKRRRGAPRGLILLVIVGVVFWGMFRPRMPTRFSFGSPAPRVRAITPPRVVRPSTAPTTQANRPWVDDWIAFVNAGNFQGFRAESSDTAVTESESRDEANAAAVDDLQQLILNRPEIASLSRNPLADPDLIRREVENAVKSGRVVKEQFVRATEKSYGTLYKTYLLIDASPAKVDPIARQLMQSNRSQQKRALGTGAALAALSLVILLLYAFLNTVTKGYFVWRLRAAVILVLIAGVLIFCSIV